MTSEKNLLRPEIPNYDDESRYKRLDSGAVLDRQTGKFVSMDPDRNPWAITPATAQAMSKKSIRARRISGRRGIALGAGIELPDNASIDEINAAASSGFEAVIAHVTRTLLESKNLRGQGEVLAKLAGLMDDDDELDPNTTPADMINPRVVLILAELARKREELIDVDPE
jgi:hypothetical protein